MKTILDKLTSIYWIHTLGSKVIKKILQFKTNGIIKQLLYNGIKYKGGGKLKKDILGSGNTIIAGDNIFVYNAFLRIRGNDNKLIIGDNVIIGQGCSIWMEGNNCSITIGKDTTMTCDIHINCQENDTHIIIGNDCMFSNNIIIRTSDSHPIYDKQTGLRINRAQSIKIGDHVWIAPNSKIMKGAIIGDGSIVGSDTTISKTYPQYSLIVGRPGHVVKSDIFWTRESLF